MPVARKIARLAPPHTQKGQEGPVNSHGGANFKQIPLCKALQKPVLSNQGFRLIQREFV